MALRLSLAQLLLLSLIFLMPLPASSTTLTATFNMVGVSGTIQFDQLSHGTATTITVNLAGLQGGTNYQWEIRELSMYYDRADKCADSVLGTVLYDLDGTHGVLTTTNSNNQQFTDNNVELSDIDSVIGRSVMLDNGSHRVCATIHTSESMVTAVVLFQAPVAGMIMLRQLASDPSAETTVYNDLFYIEDSSGSTYTWSIYNNVGGIDYEKTHTARCTAVTTVYNPTGSDNSGCSTSAQGSCQIGNLSGKLGDVQVGTNKGEAVKQSVDTNLPLSGPNSVIGHTVVIKSGSNTLACGYITELRSKTVKAVFSSQNMTGSITFTQASPLDPTMVRVAFYNMQGLGKYYHVHKYPVPPRISESDEVCSSLSVSGHWNPYGIDQDSSPTPGTGTVDEYEIGDLSGKFGSLSGSNFVENYTDYNLPIFGKNSIAGRSIVIHRPDESRWICATISYPTTTKTAVVVFRAPVVGYMMLRQAEDDPFSDTSIFVNLADGSTTTNNHNWHVHEEPVTNDYMSSDSKCSSTGPHYNPYYASLVNPGYDSQCSTDNHFRCELGDISNKQSQINIISDQATPGGKYFFTDTQVPLSGVTSVIGRSIVIHDPNSGAGRYACANIYELKPVVARSSTWSEGPVSGSFEFTQNSWFDDTGIDINILGLGSQASGYHIHVLPILASAESPCSGVSVQGHFNPFNIIGSPDVGTHDMYEIGDISGKFDPMDGLQSLITTYTDSNLPMMGPQSANDRSVVIHRDDETGSRWVCSDLKSVLSPADFEVEATASIETALLTGTVTLKQVHYETGLLGDTTILVDLSPNEEGQGNTYEWNVYEGDLSCSGIGDIYNPYMVNTQGSYETVCSLAYQGHCQVGDLTGRYGNLAPDNGRVRFTDVNLPLIGDSSVIGHTLQLASSAGYHMYCLTILPTEESGAETYLHFANLEEPFDQYHFRQTVANFAGVEMWRVVASRVPTTLTLDCQKIIFWFVGPDSTSIKNSFMTAAQGDSNEDLGIYAPTDNCPLDSDVSSAHQFTASLPLLQLASLLNSLL